ncbi:MAG: hypothetical protein COB83_10070 [Gammaproteobacteria bacterium]|nr:MAG: hypothetical protein COB83_10070 [Gammaproteobacteria bacterium]
MNIKSITFLQILSFVIVASLLCLSLVTGATAVTTPTKKVFLSPIKGTFLQSKNIKPLKRPFRSEGSFVYWPNKGLLWQTKKPVNSLKLFANGGVFKIDEQGELHKEAKLDNDFFLALFSGDKQQLAKFFTRKTLQDETDEHSSCLALTPKSDTMRSLFKQINLCMKEMKFISAQTQVTKTSVVMPSKIVLIEAEGNNTEIQLQLSSEQISSQELAYFD